MKSILKLAKKDAEMIQIRVQMAEMAKIINSMQHQQPQSEVVTPITSGGRGRGRGQHSARGGLTACGGRGRGRGRGPSPNLASSQDDPTLNPQKRTTILRSE